MVENFPSFLREVLKTTMQYHLYLLSEMTKTSSVPYVQRVLRVENQTSAGVRGG